MKRFMTRAQGRSTPKIQTLSHIELALEEKPETRGET
jgi:ribosomal protein L22